MAFGFQPYTEENTNIDYTKCTAISVIATFNRERKMKPLYISITDLYGNVLKTKIDFVKFTKEGPGTTSFYCAYTTNHIQKECVLTYYIKEHQWVLMNP